MKKIYQIPAIQVVELNGGAVCQSLIIGSGQSATGRGNGTDLVKENTISSTTSNYSVWDDDWSE